MAQALFHDFEVSIQDLINHLEIENRAWVQMDVGNLESFVQKKESLHQTMVKALERVEKLPADVRRAHAGSILKEKIQKLQALVSENEVCALAAYKVRDEFVSILAQAASERQTPKTETYNRYGLTGAGAKARPYVTSYSL